MGRAADDFVIAMTALVARSQDFLGFGIDVATVVD